MNDDTEGLQSLAQMVDAKPFSAVTLRNMRETLSQDASTMTIEERIARMEAVSAIVVEGLATLMVSIVESTLATEQIVDNLTVVLQQHDKALVSLLGETKPASKIITLDSLGR